MLAPLGPRRADVLVIGAGMAGLTAAQELQTAGQDVTVLEARDRLGGRIHTDREHFAGPTDLGAMWLHQDHENHNPLVDLAARLGIQTTSDVQRNLAYDGAGSDPVKEGEAFGETREELNEAWGKTQDDVALSQLPVGDEKWSRVAAASLGPLDMGAELHEISARDFGQMTGEDEDRQLPQGMGQLVDKLSSGLDIQTNTPVQTVHWNQDGVVVEAGGRSWKARKLVVTASTGVLASGQIKFDPPLPAWKTQAFTNLPMGAFNKVIMEFDRNVTPGVEPGTLTHSMTSPQPVEFLVRPFDSNTVVGLVGGDYARQLEHEGDGAAVDFALTELEQLYGPQVRDHVTHTHVTRWVSDPYSQGSYAHAAPGHADARELLARPVEDVLFFAGEACSQQWATTVAGAHVSGKSAAQAILAGG